MPYVGASACAQPEMNSDVTSDALTRKKPAAWYKELNDKILRGRV